MLGPASGLTTFRSETNPAIIRITTDSGETARSRDLLVTSGQTVNDMFKYVETPPTSRLDLAEASLRWRHLAPTAPDTLWCHPYFTTDPFVIEKTPDIYVIGNQDEFGTRMINSVANNGEPVRCRVILIPRFSQTGAVVLVNLVTMNVKIVELVVPEVEHSIS
jgi:DNA polymerase delta subunit 2